MNLRQIDHQKLPTLRNRVGTGTISGVSGVSLRWKGSPLDYPQTVFDLMDHECVECKGDCHVDMVFLERPDNRRTRPIIHQGLTSLYWQNYRVYVTRVSRARQSGKYTRHHEFREERRNLSGTWNSAWRVCWQLTPPSAPTALFNQFHRVAGGLVAGGLSGLEALARRLRHTRQIALASGGQTHAQTKGNSRRTRREFREEDKERDRERKGFRPRNNSAGL